MQAPSRLDFVSATPEISGFATRPASAMGQTTSTPRAELVDAVSTSPLEPFANPDAARKKLCEEPAMAQDVKRTKMAADGLLDSSAACADCEWFAEQCKTKEELEWFAEQRKKCPVCKTAELVAVPIEKYIKIYLCEDKPPAPGVTHAHFDTVGTLYARFDLASFVAKSGSKQLEDFFAVRGDTCNANFCFNLDGPRMSNKMADLLYNLAKHSKIAYKRATHHLYVFSKDWDAELEDIWSDHIKDKFREHFRVAPSSSSASSASSACSSSY